VKEWKIKGLILFFNKLYNKLYNKDFSIIFKRKKCLNLLLHLNAE